MLFSGAYDLSLTLLRCQRGAERAALGKTVKQVEYEFDVFRLQAYLRLDATMLPCPYATSPTACWGSIRQPTFSEPLLLNSSKTLELISRLY